MFLSEYFYRINNFEEYLSMVRFLEIFSSKRLLVTFTSRQHRHQLFVSFTRNCPRFTYPSPSSVMDVSAKTLSTRPTVVFSLQSMPKRQHSSARVPILETTTKYLVRFGWTLSNLTACNNESFVKFGQNKELKRTYIRGKVVMFLNEVRKNDAGRQTVF